MRNPQDGRDEGIAVRKAMGREPFLCFKRHRVIFFSLKNQGKEQLHFTLGGLANTAMI